METGLFTGFQGRRADPVRNGVTERPLWSHIPGEWELIRGERPAADSQFSLLVAVCTGVHLNC